MRFFRLAPALLIVCCGCHFENGTGPDGYRTTLPPPPEATPDIIIEKPKNRDAPSLQVMEGRTSVWEGRVVGEVLDADFQTGRVLIDQGFGDIKDDWKFEVRRGGKNGKLIALIQVTRLGKGLSRCSVIKSILPIRKGDTIISK